MSVPLVGQLLEHAAAISLIGSNLCGRRFEPSRIRWVAVEQHEVGLLVEHPFHGGDVDFPRPWFNGSTHVRFPIKLRTELYSASSRKAAVHGTPAFHSSDLVSQYARYRFLDRDRNRQFARDIAERPRHCGDEAYWAGGRMRARRVAGRVPQRLRHRLQRPAGRGPRGVWAAAHIADRPGVRCHYRAGRTGNSPG
jgi:hypothetical protein